MRWQRRTSTLMKGIFGVAFLIDPPLVQAIITSVKQTERGTGLLKRSLPFIIVIAAFLYSSCDFGAAPQNTLSKKQDLQCPSVVRRFPNLELKDLSAEALGYIRKYSLPIGDRVAFCRYLERIQHEHEAKIEEGLLDMMGDYFLTTQKIETGYYFSYKIAFPDREIPQVVRNGASSESEQADLFLKAIDSDPDAARKALFEKQIKTLSSSNRKDGTLKLVRLLLAKSWVFNPAIQKYLGSESYRDDSYSFVDRGLRTTSYAHMGATLDSYFNRSTAESSTKPLPETAKRILIIGPGLDFSNPELGEEIPQQSYEPFAVLETLLKSKRSDFKDIQIDLFDISPRVVEHWENLLRSANDRKPARLMLVSGSSMLRGGNQASNQAITSYLVHFGDSLPGVMSEISAKKSRRPAPRTLSPDSVSVRTLTVPPAVVKKFHPFLGDLTTTDLGKLATRNGGTYDLIFCFNTLEYLDETERALAGINIRESLAANGAFVTDNRFEADLGERPQQPKNGGSAAKPIFEASFFEMAAEVTAPTGRHIVIYRKNSPPKRVAGARPVSGEERNLNEQHSPPW